MVSVSYEAAMMKCGELLVSARAVDSQENREAVSCMQQVFGFSGLQMVKKIAHTGEQVQELWFFGSKEACSDENPFVYTAQQEDGITVVYSVYRDLKNTPWDEQALKRLSFFLMMLHQSNERQTLVNDAFYNKYHDPQTRHTNMLFFVDRCDGYIKLGKIADYTAMAVNISDFTGLNMLLGSETCDRILAAFMDWLQEGLSGDEVVSRDSGDEFVLLIHKENEPMILNKLRSSRICYGDKPEEYVNVSAEAGIYRLTEQVENHHQIVQGISSALNAAKNSLQLQWSYYDQVTADASARRKKYEAMFEVALKNEDIHIYFQPKVSLKDYNLIGAEALSRWIMDGKIVPPDSFIPILEETDRICKLDFYVLEHVCKSIRDWLDQGIQPVKVSVNFSRRHLANPNLVHHIVAIVDHYRVPHEYIEVELTETTVDADFEALKQLVYGLRDKGIESSVDDFGMGYSSLSLIRDVPFKVLKIDKSFLGDKNMDSVRQRSMMKHVIHMANDLGMECIAEGVESMEHVQVLKENKCYMAQGFLFNRPIPKGEFETMLVTEG
ncbi:MAG: bifunctional diguanylate cyclase/phosphodiesterase [bacterium]|nr:bifunctional diguanylate cyclase/phosphodiesterase [bacterium]